MTERTLTCLGRDPARPRTPDGDPPEKYRARVFSVKTPHSVNTFLVDGQVAGTWRYEKNRVKLTPFGRLDKATRRELDEEAGRLAAFHS